MAILLIRVTRIMSRRKRKAHDLTKLAADLSREDGSNARDFHSKPWNAPQKASRKGQQLCGQVKDALNMALPACADSVLQGLIVVAVEPAPHTGRLLVLVSYPADVERGTVVQALARANGLLRGEVGSSISRRYVRFLRGEVGSSISRRNVPELMFEVVGS
jgi:ribosome-binding factor A